MGKHRGSQGDYYGEPGGRDRSGRWEEKRQRFAGNNRVGHGFSTRALIAAGFIALMIVFVGVMTLRNSSTSTASAAVLQQVPASTATAENGRVGITVQEVTDKKLVAWDYKKGSTSIPLMAYVTPSGAVKVAVRTCEPCNGFSFRIEGNQIVCNTCGTRWDLESSKGISGGCQGYPPDVLPGSVVDGKITVDEQKVSSWKPRI